MPVMNVLLLLLAARLLDYPGHVTGQLTAPLPTCPGDTFTFRCTVTGDRNGITVWRVGGSSECSLVHSTADDPGPCGSGSPFTVTTGTGFKTSGTSFSSTLSGTATSELDGTLVECFGPDFSRDADNMVGNSTLQILSPPSVPILSCVDLSEDVGRAVNVTVSWTLSGGDSADFFLINITTNAPQAPYGGLLNVTTASVTQHELTGFMAGYEYNITVSGVTALCDGFVGRESEPLTITPQVPVVPSSCNITLLYKSTGRLEHIVSTWKSVSDPVNPGKACPGLSGGITQYQISFQTKSDMATEIMNSTKCISGICIYQPASNGRVSSSYDNVSVAAENVIGIGTARTCTTQTINMTNNLLAGEVLEVTASNGATLNCIFLSGFTGTSRCTVQYGTDPTYMNLPYSAESTETGTAGNTVSVVLRERLNSSTVYYYTMSAVSVNMTVVVQGNFTTPQIVHTITVFDQPSLLDWNVALIVTGVLALVVAIVIIISGTAVSYTRKDKKTQWQILYLALVVIGSLFGVAFWIAVGVVVSKHSTCDKSWQHSRNGLIVSGFVASIMTFIFATAAMAWVHVRHKKTNPERHTEQDGSDEGVEIQAIKEERYCTPTTLDQTHSKTTPPGVMYADLRPQTPSAAVSPPTIDGNVQYTLLVHNQNTANQRILDPEDTLQVNVDTTIPLQSAFYAEDISPPIPPKQFSAVLPCPSKTKMNQQIISAPQPLPEQLQYTEVEMRVKHEPKVEEKRKGEGQIFA